MGDFYTPTGLANQALDAVLWPAILGDLEDGSDEARICLRAYRPCRQQLLRAAHWNMARQSTPLTLLADASGNTPLVGTVVPNPWFIYEYAYPIDCLKARFIPWNLANQAQVIPAGNIQPPNPQAPLTTGIGNQPLLGQRIMPAKFTVETDFNYPPPAEPPDVMFPGISPQGRTVICTNVRFATLVYTTDVMYPQLWDPLFRAAFVAYLASEIAGPIWAKKDPKFGLAQRNTQIEVVKGKVMEARVANGNEAGGPTTDIAVDWMRTRHTGGSWRGWGWGGGGGGGDGPGVWGYGWDSMPLAGGAYF